MGKPKKGKKGQEDFEDNEVDLDPLAKPPAEEESEPAAKPAKKGKKSKKAQRDEDLDDVADEIAAMSLEANKGLGNGTVEEEAVSQPAPKKKEKKKKKKDEEEEEEDSSVSGGTSAMARFQMLGMMDDDDDDKDSDEDEEPKSKPTSDIILESVGDQDGAGKSKKDKKKKKGKDKAKTAEEEDVDAILAALEEPTEKKKGKKKKKGGGDETEEKEEKDGEEQAQTPVEAEKVEPKVVTIDDYESEEDTKKKKKKKGKQEKEEQEEEKEGEGGAEEEAEEGGTVKTAAQKKKEKKERERQKKLQQAQQQKKKEDQAAKQEGTEAGTPDREATPAAVEEAEAKPQTEEAEGQAEGEGEGKEGKKKKKKKGEKEEEKKPKVNKRVAAIKEALAKQREEEERLRQQQEEEERREEERIRKLEEQKRLEEEKRLKKKQKKKEREERLKKEGKLLTEKQKQDRIRLNQMLETIKSQGGVVPNKDEVPKKRPVYGKKKKDNQSKTGEETEKSPSPEDERPLEEVVPTATEEVQEQKTEEEAQPEAKEEEEEEEEDVKDAWDVSSEEEEEEEEEEKAVPAAKAVTTKAAAPATSKKVAEKEEEEEEESEEEESESEEEESSEESESEDDRPPAEKGREKVQKRREAAEKKRTTDSLRAPVVCVLGHVDTGKTKILDKLRRTNVQDGEAGGITQQIGATNVPHEAILEKTKMCKEFGKQELKLPGLLIIDTPGHESFSNLRSRGSSLCDIAILVIDIMHGLEPQTIESINLLKQRKTPFVVALNKIDRLYQWKTNPNADVVNTIKRQSPHTKSEFDERTRIVITQLAEEGLNAALFYENKNPKEYVSLMPTSAHSGDGMGNLVALICELCQNMLAKRLAYCEDLQATVMEVKAIHGLGTTIDVILVNGKLEEGKTMVLAGTEGPIITPIRGLLMPQPMKELRVKNQYEHHKEVKAAQGVKIIAKDLEKALAGLPLYIAHDQDEVEYYKQEVERALEDALQSIKLSDRGVFVQASTLGSLEALLEFLRTSKIKYAGINIGPVHKKDIMKASVMLEHDPQYAVILAFDVKVEREAQELADSLGVTIFTADIIYHLFDKFTAYRAELLRKKQEEFKHVAVFPCKLRILPQYVFNSRDPIVVGVVVEAGFVKEGTPICVPSKEFVDIGRVASIEFNHKPVDKGTQGQEVCIKIVPVPGEAPKMFGRHFDETDLLVSKISRESIDAVKDYFRKEMSKSDWMLIMELKKMFQIL